MARKMIKTIHYSYRNKGPDYQVNMEIDLSRFEKQYSLAQFKLDSMVMTDMVPYMPMETGTFIQVTRAMSAAIAGSGKVVAAAPPMGRFLYEGKTMVDEATGSPWARKGAKKVLVSQYSGETNAKENLTYAHGRKSHWFEEAKKRSGGQWIRKTKRTAGGNR